MDYRSSSILNQLITGECPNVTKLAEEFQVSDRMVRKIIKELDKDLEIEGLSQLRIDGKGNVSFCEKAEDATMKVQQIFLGSNFYTYRLSPNERRTILAMLLLNSQGYRTAADLSRYLETSRNTIINDINDLKDWFEENNMRLLPQVQKGYEVIGDEKDIRQGILKLVKLNPDYKNYREDQVLEAFQHLLLKELDYENRIDGIKEIVREEEIHHDIYFSDFSFMEVVYELLILCKRLSIGKTVPKDHESIKNSSKYPISNNALDRLSQLFELEIPEQEKGYFARCLRRKSYIKSSTKHVDDMVIQVMIGEVIYRICEQIQISFYLDFALYDVLVDHMKSVIYRSKNGEFLKNPFGKEILEKYPEVFCVVEESVRPLEIYIGCNFKKDEISFLVMYFASMMEREQIDKAKKYKVSVALILGFGRGTVRLVESELAKFADIIEVVTVKTGHDLMDFKPEEVDMIISMVSYTHPSIPCIKLQSPLLSKEESYRIRITAMELLEEKQGKQREKAKIDLKQMIQELYRRKESFLRQERICLDVEVNHWEDAIRFAGKLLYQSGIVTEKYIDAMVDVVKNYGSYIVIYPGLAMPHAEREKGALEEGISLVRLKNPVEFKNTENNPVKYVVGLSVKGSDSINELIYNMIKIFSNEEFRMKMDEVETVEEMYQLLEDKI